MNNKKSKIFANKIEKEIKNNNTYYYSNNDEKEGEIKEEKQKNTTKINEKNIKQKINSIFSSPRYVYKADVKIKLKDEEIKTKIIGQNATHLITLNNELIPIVDIVDIEYDN